MDLSLNFLETQGGYCMQVDPANSPVSGGNPIPTGLYQKLSPSVEKIVQLDPKILLGQSALLKYHSESHSITLSSSFQNLLELLVQVGELDSKALTARSLDELNTVLQQDQGQGGLIRKAGTERWEMKDNANNQQNRQTLEELLQQLGFVLPQSLDEEMTVDHCIIFGAHTERMEARIKETLASLNKNLHVSGHIFLLGSNRKLVQEEINHIKSKVISLDDSQMAYWTHLFNNPDHATEANAFEFLWKCLAPSELHSLFEKKVIPIKSTRIGNSYKGEEGHRVTTEITIDDWMTFYQADQPQAIFALAEQPYIRLTDQLRVSVVSKVKKATTDELIARIKNTIFYFGTPTPSKAPLISVVFDEVARHVYRIRDTLHYLESLK